MTSCTDGLISLTFPNENKHLQTAPKEINRGVGHVSMQSRNQSNATEWTRGDAQVKHSLGRNPSSSREFLELPAVPAQVGVRGESGKLHASCAGCERLPYMSL